MIIWKETHWFLKFVVGMLVLKMVVSAASIVIAGTAPKYDTKHGGVFPIQAARATTVTYTFAADAAVSTATIAGGTATAVDGNGKTRDPVGIFFSCETYAIRYAFKGTASQTLGHLLLPNQSIYHTGEGKEIINMTYANDTAGENGVLQVTLEH